MITLVGHNLKVVKHPSGGANLILDRKKTFGNTNGSDPEVILLSRENVIELTNLLEAI
jgi:hypothetical protein